MSIVKLGSVIYKFLGKEGKGSIFIEIGVLVN